MADTKKKLFEKFGEFGSAEELNRAAEGLKEEGDTQGLRLLAEENGIDLEDAADFIWSSWLLSTQPQRED